MDIKRRNGHHAIATEYRLDRYHLACSCKADADITGVRDRVRAWFEDHLAETAVSTTWSER
jgi:hypothetical protein